jgi:methyl-accepting chemotaxis protein
MSAWTIGKKITLGFLVILLLTLSVELFCLWITDRASHQLKLASTEYLPETQVASQIERDLLNARIHFIYFVTVQKSGSLDRGWERFRTAQRELPRLEELVRRSAAFTNIRPDVEQLRRDFNSYQPVLEKIIDVVQHRQNRGPAFASLLTEWARLGGAMVDSAGRLSHGGSRTANDAALTTAAKLHNATVTLTVACVTSLLLGLTLAFFVTRGINRTLGKVIQELADAAHQLMGAASQVSGSAQAIAQGASEQAASLEETSASSEEISTLSRKNASNSSHAMDLMNETNQVVTEANHTLGEMEASMHQINSSSEKIGKIIKVIDEIAFQTNILALNAAVEAARAGEAGLGFAVVADEVRNLAQRCAQAAKDTAAMIEESISKSGEGRTKLDQVSQSIRRITEKSTQVKSLVEELHTSSGQQARGISEIAKAITQVDQVTQTSAASAEEAASAGEELSAQSVSLREIVGRLQELAGGGTAQAVSR